MAEANPARVGTMTSRSISIGAASGG